MTKKRYSHNQLKSITRTALVTLLFTGIMGGCSYFLLEDIFIPMNFVAADTAATDSAYIVDGRTWVWQQEGVKIEVEQMTDPMLNALYPEISKRGQFSTNPYTFGNWVDLEKGYTPAKFTVFAVRIFNYTQPKIELDPRKIELHLDNGAVLKSYGLDQYDEPPNLERYFIAEKGASGNERRRFKEKLGKAKETMLLKDPIFKGNTAEGLVVFDPLPPEVKTLKVVIRDFVLRFDANDWPYDIRTLTMVFERKGNVAATAAEIKTPADSLDSNGADNQSGTADEFSVTTLTQELEIRNTNAYDALLRLLRSDDRFADVRVDVEIATNGSVNLIGFLKSTGSQNLDDQLKAALEALTFSPVRTMGSQGYYIPVPVQFQLSFGLSPLFPKVRISPGKVEPIPAIGAHTQSTGTLIPATGNE
ncbi:MAG: energy transducer TonB [Lentisphaeria bacterium]|nr:energy transducer TonB [Candidatus Neomarinimicrobiota bacterium]MCF7843074.1 energy transducer TonB [Lentisphaeria bacterium]